MGQNRIYLSIDLKSFYASVECMERGLDPLTTNLVVADASRTEKTICLAVSPSLKAYGISGRARLFEVVQRVKEVNARRQQRAPARQLTGSSCDAEELRRFPALAVDYIAAPPRMSHYMEYSTRIYRIYLNYVAPEDIHVYSIDEVFMDVTAYLKTYGLSARQLASQIVRDVFRQTGITATAGIGTNLYLCKVALDIVAKHVEPDASGARIAQLDEASYRRQLWDHRPLTDFWRVGRGYAKKLEANGMFTMGDVARCSLGGGNDILNEKLLYKLFGVNAELLIDHAWGWEPCTIADIKAYRPSTSSLGSGQVLSCPYTAEKGRLIVREMADQLALDLVSKRLMSDQLVLTVGYDVENLTDARRARAYHGAVDTDRYGRKVPKHAHGTVGLEQYTSSSVQITKAALELYDRIIDPTLLIRRVYLTANRVRQETDIFREPVLEQLDLFTDHAAEEKRRAEERAALERERRRQEAVLEIKRKYGKNAILRGMNLEEGATTVARNGQIGGHKA